MASGFDGSVSRIQPRTKKQFFRPNINNKPSDPKKIKQVTPAVLNKEKDEIDKIQKPKNVQKTHNKKNTGDKIVSGNNMDPGNNSGIGNNSGVSDNNPDAVDKGVGTNVPAGDNIRNKNRVPVQKTGAKQDKKAEVSESSAQPMKLYSIHKNNISDNVEKLQSQSIDTSDNTDSQSQPLNEKINSFETLQQRKGSEEKKVEKILPYEKPALGSRKPAREIHRHNVNETVNRYSDFNGNEVENENKEMQVEKKTDFNGNEVENENKEMQVEKKTDFNGNEAENENKEMQVEKKSSGPDSIQDRYKSLKKRLDSFINQDTGNSVKKNKAYENADTIKNVIRNYQSKIKHLTEELAALEDTYKFTRDELEAIRQDLYKKTLSLEQATKLGKEKTILSEEILKEMEIAVFERDRAFTTIAELKTANKSNEELLRKASISLEEKAKELEEATVRETELLQTIKQKDGEIHNLQLVLAKRTADRDELFDRLEDISIQLEEIDKSNNALNEIKGLIDRDENELLE